MRTNYFICALAILVIGCEAKDAGNASDSDDMTVVVSSTSAPPEFQSPDDAFALLAQAAKSDEVDALRSVFGPGADAILDTGDPVQFRNELDAFVARYDESRTTQTNDDGSVTLVVGENEWPFPVPLVEDGGLWHFDLERGEEEIANRRIGRNELAAIQVCRAIGDAQHEYRALNPKGGYASKFFSDPGERNGLFWPTDAGEAPSPLGELIALAADEGYERGTVDNPAAYHGYHYRILQEQGPDALGGEKSYLVDGKMTGGYAIVAWPAEYGTSGITTFLMNRFGVVYQQDLGEDTPEIAANMTAFNPDNGWTITVD